MTKQELINDIARATGIEKAKVSPIVEALMDTVKSSMVKMRIFTFGALVLSW